MPSLLHQLLSIFLVHDTDVVVTHNKQEGIVCLFGSSEVVENLCDQVRVFMKSLENVIEITIPARVEVQEKTRPAFYSDQNIETVRLERPATSLRYVDRFMKDAIWRLQQEFGTAVNFNVLPDKGFIELTGT